MAKKYLYNTVRPLPISLAKTFYTGLVVIGSLSMAACGSNMADLESYVQVTLAKKGRPIKPIPKMKSYEVFEYPGHERSPFDASAIAAQPDKPKSTASITIDVNRPPEYLENFPLDSLGFVGTLEQEGIQWGLVKGPDGTIQRVRAGNYMGQNYGKITRITEIDIQLEEVVPDGFGGYKKRANSVALSE